LLLAFVYAAATADDLGADVRLAYYPDAPAAERR
jgi:hypothetical protein